MSRRFNNVAHPSSTNAATANPIDQKWRFLKEFPLNDEAFFQNLTRSKSKNIFKRISRGISFLRNRGTNKFEQLTAALQSDKMDKIVELCSENNFALLSQPCTNNIDKIACETAFTAAVHSEQNAIAYFLTKTNKTFTKEISDGNINEQSFIDYMSEKKDSKLIKFYIDGIRSRGKDYKGAIKEIFDKLTENNNTDLLSFFVIEYNKEIKEIFSSNNLKNIFFRRVDSPSEKASQAQMISYLLNHDKQILSKNLHEGLVPFLHFIPLMEDPEKILATIILDKPYAAAQAILALTYSKNKFSTPNTPKLISDFLETSDIEDKQKFLPFLRAIQNKSLITIKNKEFKIIKSSINNHSSYFVVEYGKDNRPIKLSYCDGHCVFSDKNLPPYHGETIFNIKEGIDATKLQSCIEKITDNKREFMEGILKDIVVTDKDGKPSFTNNIEVKPQKRGNCSSKSLFITMRALMMKEDNYDINDYKSFKQSLINESLNILFKTAQENESPQLQADAKKFLKTVILPKAQEKIDYEDDDLKKSIHEEVIKKITSIIDPPTRIYNRIKPKPLQGPLPPINHNRK